MESPVRICLGAALVVNILLLTSTSVTGSALPFDTTPTTVKDEGEGALRYGSINGTWAARNKPKSPDVSLNELKPKDSTSEEHTEKNAKYKDRGRVRYTKTTTESSLRRIRSTEDSKLVVVTPTAEVKKPVDIIDSMHTYKRTKLPYISSTNKLPLISSSTPSTVKKEEHSEEEAYEDEDDEDDKETFEKFSSSKFDNFFTMPSYNYGDDFTHDTDNESSDNKVNKNDYSSPTYSGFSSLFPGGPSYGYKDTTHDVFKSESFFTFDSDLTTPKNDFFDEKFQKITSSIKRKLDTIKAKAPPANMTNVHKIVQENVDMEKVGNNTPSNKSSVFIRNTKEIRLLDSDGASSANKELSDIQGTSIYYEMSVLSTENYAINSEDDCDNESLAAEPTVGTTSEEELASLKVKKEKPKETATPTLTTLNVGTVKPNRLDSISDSAKQTSPKYKPSSSSRTKSRFERVKSTTPNLEPDNNKTTISTEKFERVKTTSTSTRRESAKTAFSTLKPVSTKSTLSKLGSERTKPTLYDSSAESAMTTQSSLRFETANPNSNFNFETEPTIPISFETIVNPTFPSPTVEAIRPTYPDQSPENIQILTTDILPVSSVLPIFNSIISVPVSTQNIIPTTDRSVKIFSNSYTRNISYSKRLNLNGNKDSPNSVTSKPEVSSTTNPRSLTRKFYYSTPRTKPIWMVPRRNVTKSYVKPTYPTTIYSEHFNIKDKYKKLTTVRPKQSYKTVLTTISSDIDPVLESDVSGTKKIVHSQFLTDNTVPGLWKRGSTRFGTSTSSSTEVDTDDEEWQIPPTSTVWALASLRSPPPTPHSALNRTRLPQKNIDENELQKVGEVIDKKETTTASSIPTTVSPISNDIIPKKVTEVVLNKLPWQPILAPRTPSSVTQTEAQNEIKSETIPAESNISVQSSIDPATTETNNEQENQTGPWIPVTFEKTNKNQSKLKTIPPVGSTKSTGFESITKLPADVTTPQDETVAGSEDSNSVADENPQTTTDYTITTIRFSYVPTEEVETETQPMDITPTTWHPVFPTRTRVAPVKDTPITTYRPTYMTTTESVEDSTTVIPETTSHIEVKDTPITTYRPTYMTKTELVDESTTVITETTSRMEVKDTPITTYRPTYMTTTKMVDESSTVIPETTSSIEVSSQVLENASKLLSVTTEMNEPTSTILSTTMEPTQPTTTEELTNPPTTPEVTTQPTTAKMSTEPTTVRFITQPITTEAPTTPPTTTEFEDTTTIVVEVVTEINTEREQIITSTIQPVTTETPPSDLHDDCTEENSGKNIITEEKPETTTIEITTIKLTTIQATTPKPTTPNPITYRTTTEIIEETIRTEVPIEPKLPETTTKLITVVPETTQANANIMDTTIGDITTDNYDVTKLGNKLEDVNVYPGEATTTASSITRNEEDTSSGAAVAIAVSTIGVIALILLIGLLLVVRRRGRRGVYAQRCTPVSLDAYSLDSVSVGHRKGNQRLRASKRSYGNPAYDDEVTSHPMQYAALANFALDVESMTAEFAEIPSVSVRPDEVPPGCEDKNRYSNVLPLPETRVPLRRIGNDPASEYINANYVTGPGNIRNYYIASQAPLSNTVVDFWRMIWEQNSRLIVMLTEYMENGVEKCYEYIPPSEITDNKRTFGEFKIILKKREQRDKYAISSIQLINLTTRTWREITHLWYFWPAKGVPDDYDSIIDFLCEMRTYMKISQTAKEFDEEGVEVIYGDQSRSSFNNLSKLREDGVIGHGVNVYSPARAEERLRRAASNNGTLGRMKAASEVEGIRPCVVTCASGAGRSAALIALDISARALPAGTDVPRVVRNLRAQRPHSLSNRHHYIFVYKVLSEYGNKILGGGVDTI